MQPLEQIRAIADRVARSRGLEVWDLVSRREMGTILDVEDPLPFNYTLEVSSPGLDRPLRGAEDYRRFAGRLAKIVLREAVDNQKAFEGRLRGVEESGAGETAVLLEGPKGRTHRLPMQLIARGRLEVEF